MDNFSNSYIANFAFEFNIHRLHTVFLLSKTNSYRLNGSWVVWQPTGLPADRLAKWRHF